MRRLRPFLVCLIGWWIIVAILMADVWRALFSSDQFVLVHYSVVTSEGDAVEGWPLAALITGSLIIPPLVAAALWSLASGFIANRRQRATS
jgi:hypothetical protein